MYSLAAPLDSALGVASCVASKNIRGDDPLRALSQTHGGSFVGPHLTSVFKTAFVSLHSQTAVVCPAPLACRNTARVAGDLGEL